MTDAPKRLYGPAQLTASAATLYTVPAVTTTILRYIRVVNTTATDRTFTLSIGANAAATQLFAAVNVPANGYHESALMIPLQAAEIIQGLASAATALTIILAGIEVTT